MRVLMSADTVGGVWTYALELARGLIEAGDEVVIAAMGGRLSAAQAQEAAHVSGLTVHDSDYPLEWMDEPWEGVAEAGQWLQRLARELRPDVVHLNHYAHGELRWGAPVVRVAHSCVCSWYAAVHDRPPEPRWDRYRQEVRLGLHAADVVVAPTAAMLREAERFYGPFRGSRVILNGRRAEDFRPRAKRPLILSAGRLWDEAKNVITLARAAADLPWKVALAGESRAPGGAAAEFPGVQMLGRLGSAEMAQAYGRASIYVMPARYEPFGLSVLEAAHAGCALVLGDIPSLRELWDGAAFFVPPGDQAALTEILRWLIDDAELRQAYAERAQDRAARYNAERMTGAYRQLYQHLMDEVGAARRYAQGG